MFGEGSNRGRHRVLRRAIGGESVAAPRRPQLATACAVLTCLVLGSGVAAAAPPPSIAPELERVANPSDGSSLPSAVAEIQTRLAAVAPSVTLTTELRGARAKAMPDLVLAYAEGRAFSFRGNPQRVRDLVALGLFGATRGQDPTERGPLADVDVVVIRDDDTARVHVIVPRDDERGGPRRHEWRNGDETWVPLSDFARPGLDYTLYKRDGTQSLADQWARREVVEQLAALALAYREKTGHRLGIGDLSQLFGGKLQGHWTHRRGIDADVYLLDDKAPIAWCHHEEDGVVTWTREPGGKGEAEPPAPRPGEDTASRLTVLAALFVENDDIAYLVHDATSILAPFDEAAHARRPGRHVLHLRNRLYWPSHPDHAHLRWHLDDRALPEVPRP